MQSKFKSLLKNWGFSLIFQDFDRAMLDGLKRAKALRQQGGGDRESRVAVQQSQV